MTREFPAIQMAKTVYVVFANSDLTEGRGMQMPVAVCLLEATARRLAKKRDVMGADATVVTMSAFKINEVWFIPGDPYSPTPEDERMEPRIVAFRNALARAQAAGLSQDEIKALGILPPWNRP